MRLSYLGPSSDQRTNRWRLTCDCGYTWEPRTTMFSLDHITCYSCNNDYFIDYNKQKATKL